MSISQRAFDWLFLRAEGVGGKIPEIQRHGEQGIALPGVIFSCCSV